MSAEESDLPFPRVGEESKAMSLKVVNWNVEWGASDHWRLLIEVADG